MTAREDLIEYMDYDSETIGNEYGADPDAPATIRRLVADLVAEVRHEAAEEIRAFVGPRELPSGPEPTHVERFVAGCHDAADLIDPEVQS